MIHGRQRWASVVLFFILLSTLPRLSLSQSDGDLACGPRAVFHVLRLYSKEVDFSSLCEELGYDPASGVSVGRILEVLRSHGLSATVMKLEGSVAPEWNHPVIVYATPSDGQSGHFWVERTNESGIVTAWDGVPSLSDATRTAMRSSFVDRYWILVSDETGPGFAAATGEATGIDWTALLSVTFLGLAIVVSGMLLANRSAATRK